MVRFAKPKPLVERQYEARRKLLTMLPRLTLDWVSNNPTSHLMNKPDLIEWTIERWSDETKKRIIAYLDRLLVDATMDIGVKDEMGRTE